MPSGFTTINGDNANNTLTGTAGPDRIDGRGGDDVIYAGGGNDTLMGGAGDDRLFGGDGDDVLKGEAGANTMTGGAGDDHIFAAGTHNEIDFHFVLTETAGPSGQFDPSGIVDQDDLSRIYGAWLAQFGHDVDGDGVVTVYDLGQNGGYPVIEGGDNLTFSDQVSLVVATGGGNDNNIRHNTDNQNTQTREIYLDVTGPGQESLASPDGHDLVEGFNWGADKLRFDVVLTEAQFDNFFQVSTVNVGGDPSIADTMLSLKDGTWSVTLVDVTGYSLHDFYSTIAFG